MTQSIDEQNGIPSPLPVPEPVPVELPERQPQFSPIVTGLAAVVLVAGLSMFGWLQATVPRLARVAAPERALELMVGRTMDVEEALARAPFWERYLYDLTLGEGGNELPLAIAWYEELAIYSQDPWVVLHLAVLEGEAGRLEEVRRKVRSWAKREAPYPLFARLVQAGYLEQRLEPDHERTLQAHLAEVLPAGWFYDRVSIQLATRAGDRRLLSETGAAQAVRNEPLLARVRWLAAIQLGGILVGAAALVLVVRRRRMHDGLKVSTAPLPPPWRGRTGALVLIHGGAIGTLVMFALLSLGTNDVVLEAVSIPAVNLPLLLLARRHLFEPAGLGLSNVFGFRLETGARGRLWIVVAALLAASFVAEWGMGRVADWSDLSSHWTEWFDEDLVWGSLPVLAVSLVEYVLFAPVFEEIVFRGLLFATLRRRFGWGTAAVLSATIFAVAHGYGVLGFFSVFWSGLLWAWVYEKSGSLLPGIVAHTVNNLFVCFTVIWFLRW